MCRIGGVGGASREFNPPTRKIRSVYHPAPGLPGQEPGRVLWHTLHEHLKMQMRARRSPSAAHVTEVLLSAKNVTGLYAHGVEVGITGRQVIAMIQCDQVAVLGVLLNTHHHAPGCGMHRRTGRCGKIQSRVQGPAPCEGVETEPKT